MPKFQVLEKKTVGPIDRNAWVERLRGMSDVTLLRWLPNGALEVEAGDEIALRMAVSDTCRIDRL
jgi:hypothetical protein